jgi:hypothetical protein
MVVLKYMLSRRGDHWLDPVTPEEVSPFFHKYLTEKEYRRRIDFSDKAVKQMWEYNEKKVARLVATMPMTKWSGSSKGMVLFRNNSFLVHKRFAIKVNEYIYIWTSEICEYRLHYHFEKNYER